MVGLITAVSWICLGSIYFFVALTDQIKILARLGTYSEAFPRI
jgi:hypothetical protein